MFALETTPFDFSKWSDMMNGADLSKMFELPELGALDQNAFLDAHRKNIEALTTAQQIATAGYQDMFEKQIAMIQAAVSSAQAKVADMGKAPSATDAATMQSDIIKTAYETAVSNVTELSELAQKANMDAFGVIKARMEASFQELKAA